MAKRKDSNHELERYSRGRVRMALAEWVVNSLDEDYAFDFEVRPTEGFGEGDRDAHGDAVLPSPFYIQLKASEGFANRESVYHSFDVPYLVEDCLRASIPVVLVICDREYEELYWCVLQTYCWDVLDEENEGWREQESVRVRIDREPLADSLQLSRLRGVLREAEHRIATRQRVAASRRGTLHHPSRMHVASTSQVRDYKREMVADAVELANASQYDRARQTLLEVRQMAEVDEPTLEALHRLLQLSEIENSTLAFAKIRFAREAGALAQRYDREEGVLEELREHYDEAWAYLDEHFVGAPYLDQSGLPVRILEVERLNLLSGDGAEMSAVVQHGGDHIRLQAPAIAGGEEFERVHSGEGRDPRVEACENRQHEFDAESLRRSPIATRCLNCELSGETIKQWLSHDVPRVCDSCGDVVYENPLDMESVERRSMLFCEACR
ncbi:hypothetical protein GCM10009037_19810 [Halarchaeum grantii]|uniref:DUF4365 domain-containing protein n=1 Tax=Halarchaeum grantii TaxID=1193105 RepID=A0A830FAS5_9EURY|nr:DUF4365 domain-containing protein [Halarchaeum grantii]GGL36272.1 hypothetical protein GCM10009037_19810 [Halarchaeum grantii]